MKKVTIYIYQDQGSWQVVGGPDISYPEEALTYVDNVQDETYTITPLEIEIHEWECPLCGGDRILREICPTCSGNGCRSCRNLGEVSFTCPCQE